MALGTKYTGDIYIQSVNKNSTAIYDLLLQPNGGNVGIGTPSPGTKLHVQSVGTGTTVLITGPTQGNSGGPNNDPWTGLEFQRLGTNGETYNGSVNLRAYRWATSGQDPAMALRFNLSSTAPYNTADVMTLRSDGNVGIGTTDPQGGLHVYQKTLVLGELSANPSSAPNGSMYYNTSSEKAVIKIDGSWRLLGESSFSPTSVSGLVGWYLPENWTGTQWTDTSGSGNSVTAYEGTINYTAVHDGSTVGAQSTFPVLYGNTSAELNFPSAILPSTYTLIALTRYNGTTKKRILDAQNTNWLSGHWSGASGVAYHNGWLTTTTNRHGSKWVMSTDQNNLYRSKSESVAWEESNTGAGTPSYANLRLGSVGYEGSDWMCAEIIVYNRTLSSGEYGLLETYIQNKYSIY
jgi:hypothetical protein